MAKSRRIKASLAASAISSTVSSRLTTPASSRAASTLPSRAPSPPPDEADEEETPRQPFRFLDLPSELRLRIYEFALHLTARDVVEIYEGKRKAAVTLGLDQRPAPPLDLEPVINFYVLRPRLRLFLTSRQVYNEAYRVFFSQPMRLYPVHGKFFNTKKPLLARLAPKYRAVPHTFELRLGPGWSSPPRGQNTKASLGLYECANARLLKIFIEVDPSEQIFHGFRGKNATEDTYKYFCIDLVGGIFEQMETLEQVEIDAFPGVKRDSPLVLALERLARTAGKVITWGPARGWKDIEPDTSTIDVAGLRHAMASMSWGEASRVVEVSA